MIDDTNVNRLSEEKLLQKSPIKYKLTDDEFLQLYYSEPRLAMLMDMDVIRLIDKHLVVNLETFITPKTKHLTAAAKRNLAACCIGIQHVAQKIGQNSKRTIASTHQRKYTPQRNS